MSGTRFWTKIEEIGRRAWVIIVLIGVITIGIGTANLYLQLKGREPYFITVNSSFMEKKTLVLHWDNVGGSAARNGTAALLSTDKKQANLQKIGETSLAGAGIHLLPG